MKSGKKIVLRYKLIWRIACVILGLFGLATAIKNLFFEDSIDYFSLATSVLYLILGLLLVVFQYGKIENGHIRRMDSLRKGIDLDKITHAKRVSKTYIIESGEREVAFNSRILTKKSERDLKAVLAEYGYEF